MTLPADATLAGLPSIARGEARSHPVPMERATRENLAGLAEIVPDFDSHAVVIVPWPTAGWRPLVEGRGDEGGSVSGSFEVWPEGNRLLASNEAVGRAYTLGWFCDPGDAAEAASGQERRRLYVREANYHPDGGQVWQARAGAAFVALLAPPGDDVRPEDFRAFLCDGGFGIQILPNVWHQPPLSAEAISIDDKQGRVHACVAVDTLAEFGCYLDVPLSL